MQQKMDQLQKDVITSQEDAAEWLVKKLKPIMPAEQLK